MDVTSFPNSIGPRREKGKRTLADYGFTKVERGRLYDRAGVVLRDSDLGWLIAITVLKRENGKTLICIQDKAENGGTYHTVEPVELITARDGMLRATGRRRSHPGCGRYGIED